LTCGQVLEKCPYNCLSYIQRKNMDTHLRVCSKRGQTKANGAQIEIDLELTNERLSSVEESLMSLRKALNEEIQMRHDMIGDLGVLKRRNQVNLDFCAIF
jgi:hypothetical protein